MPNFLVILICLVSFSFVAKAEEGTEEPPVEEAAAPEVPDAAAIPARIGGLNEEQLRQLAMANEAKEHEVVWLEVQYPEEEGTHQVLALEQRPRAPKGKAQGAVVLLHDKEQHADWPFLIRPLRMVLPDSGWYTIAVNLPYDDVRNIPERVLGPKEIETIEMTDEMRIKVLKSSARNVIDISEDKGEAAEADASEEADAATTEEAAETEETSEEESVDIDLADEEKPKLPYRDRAQFHLKAAVDRVAKKGYRNIVIIGYRAGAEIALDYVKPLASKVRKQGFGLVIIDPKLDLGYQTDMSSALGEDFRAPVLDVVNGSDLDSRIDAIEREAGARIANASLYRQIRLVANESSAFQQTLVRRVRSWLEKYAPGMSAKQFRDIK